MATEIERHRATFDSMQPAGTLFKPNVWKVNARQPQPAVIDSAGEIIRQGKVVVFPTETFYGLGGDPLSGAVIERIYRIKGRNWKKPLPLIAAGQNHVLRAVADWPPIADRLAGIFWPGPLTLVLPAAAILPSALHAHTGKIAIRIASHPVAQALAESAGGLLISTSANVAGKPACKDLQEMAVPFLARVDGIVDAGPLTGYLPSTIVDVAGPKPVLLREGPITWQDIRQRLRTERA